MEADSDDEYLSDRSSAESASSMELDGSGEDPGCSDNEEKSNDSKTPSSWKRSDPPFLNPETDALIFQQIDIKYYTGIPWRNTFITPRTVPITRMFGVTADGNSVCCNVYGFFPYFYVSTPFAFQSSDCEPFRQDLNRKLSEKTCNSADEAVSIVEMVERYNIYGYHGEEKMKFIKLTIVLPKLLPAVKQILENGRANNFNWSFADCMFFESNIDFEMRFMVDTGIVGCNWIELPPKSWNLRREETASHCQIEADVSFEEFISHEPDAEWSKVAPFRIISFEIKCASRPGIFPKAHHDPVIQIANILIRHGESEPFLRNVFTLKTCAPITGVQVISFNTEKELLEAWGCFIRTTDPDILTGYNINNFDLPYLIDRAQYLNIKNFEYLGRIINIPSRIKLKRFSSRQLGNRVNKEINFEGRVPFDLNTVIQREHKLRSYTLNYVSYHFLQERKEDFHHSVITKLYNGSDQTRRRLAKYCLKGAYFPIRLLNKLMCIVNYMEMARVTGVSLDALLIRGQQIKVLSQLLTAAKNRQFIIPVSPIQETTPFEGGTVLEAQRGYYSEPITILDFASMYPSIMIAHNLCYSTLLKPGMIEKLSLSSDQSIRTPANFNFVTKSVRKGLLPEILESLLAARKRIKNDLKNEKDPVMWKILNGRQLAIKLSANSVYGFTGTQPGKLPCLQIPSSVTAYGREMIERTKFEIESRYTRSNGYGNNARIIYGDTDSVMVNFGVKPLEENMKLGREAGEYISSVFQNNFTLEYENIYCPFLLISKKHYVGLYYSTPEKYDKLDCKGIETVRRDCALLVTNLLNDCLRKLMIERNTDAAIAHAKQVIADLLCNRIDISQLVITKELTKNDYSSKNPHSELAMKMKLRDPGTAPKLGDRIGYVMCVAPKNAPAYSKSEDPIYVLEEGIPIDSDYYLQNHLKKPLLRIFEPILGDRAEAILLNGDHTRTRTIVTPKSGPLTAFLMKTESCMSCKSILPRGYEKSALCSRCEPNRSITYQREIKTQRSLEVSFSRLWTECQRCQGSVHNKVLCTSSDCPIFYMRKKVNIDINKQNKMLQRFGLPLW